MLLKPAFETRIENRIAGAAKRDEDVKGRNSGKERKRGKVRRENETKPITQNTETVIISIFFYFFKNTEVSKQGTRIPEPKMLRQVKRSLPQIGN